VGLLLRLVDSRVGVVGALGVGFSAFFFSLVSSCDFTFTAIFLSSVSAFAATFSGFFAGLRFGVSNCVGLRIWVGFFSGGRSRTLALLRETVDGVVSDFVGFGDLGNLGDGGVGCAEGFWDADSLLFLLVSNLIGLRGGGRSSSSSSLSIGMIYGGL
jgi:hypothetical protein